MDNATTHTPHEHAEWHRNMAAQYAVKLGRKETRNYKHTMALIDFHNRRARYWAGFGQPEQTEVR